MKIKNSVIRRLETKRLYIMGLSRAEIAERIGGSISEIEKWRQEEGWDDEIKQLQENRKRYRNSLLSHINKLMKDIDNPAVLSIVIASTSNLPMTDIEEIARQIINHLKGAAHE